MNRLDRGFRCARCLHTDTKHRFTRLRLPDDLKPVLKQIAAKYSERFRVETRKMEIDAMAAMTARGLLVVTPRPEVVVEWDKAIENSYPEIRGSYVSAEDFDWIVEVTRTIRATP